MWLFIHFLTFLLRCIDVSIVKKKPLFHKGSDTHQKQKNRYCKKNACNNNFFHYLSPRQILIYRWVNYIIFFIKSQSIGTEACACIDPSQRQKRRSQGHRATRGFVREFAVRGSIISNFKVEYGNFSRAEYTCTRHWRTSSPMASFGMRTHIRAGNDVQDRQIKAMKCLICKARVGRFRRSRKKRKNRTFVLLSFFGDPEYIKVEGLKVMNPWIKINLRYIFAFRGANCRILFV